MAKHKISLSETELDHALAQAAQREDEPSLLAVEYRPEPGLDLLILKFSDGRRQIIPRENLQGLEAATPEQIAQMEVLGNGTGLHWPQLNLDHYVPSLLRHIYGTQRWTAGIGRDTVNHILRRNQMDNSAFGIDDEVSVEAKPGIWKIVEKRDDEPRWSVQLGQDAATTHYERSDVLTLVRRASVSEAEAFVIPERGFMG